MPNPTPKSKQSTQRRQRKAKLTPEDQSYIGNQDQYVTPENMVPLNENKYEPKDKIGKRKAVRGPGEQVSRVGLGGLKVIHQNHIDYHGNIDVRPDSNGQS